MNRTEIHSVWKSMVLKAHVCLCILFGIMNGDLVSLIGRLTAHLYAAEL